METRRERFKRLAVIRTNMILERIRILGNLSNRTNYDYTDEEVQKMFTEIESQLRAVKYKFSRKTRKEFKL